MISPDKIIQRFIQLDEYLGILRRIVETPIETFLEDRIIIGSAKYYLQISIECCLDVANHIIASEHLRAPRDYADSFMVMEEKGLFPPELGQSLRQMAKFGNRLVHLYGEIDDAYVYEFIRKDLGDIEEFKSIIITQYNT